MNRSAFFVLLLAPALLAIPAKAAEIPDVLGVAHAGGKYGFTEDDYLNEGADRLLELGTRVIKVWFQRDGGRAYRFNSEWGPPAADLAELARKPYYQELFAKPFTTFILVVESAAPASFLDGMTPRRSKPSGSRSTGSPVTCWSGTPGAARPSSSRTGKATTSCGSVSRPKRSPIPSASRACGTGGTPARTASIRPGARSDCAA